MINTFKWLNFYVSLSNQKLQFGLLQSNISLTISDIKHERFSFVLRHCLNLVIHWTLNYDCTRCFISLNVFLSVSILLLTSQYDT